MSDLPYAFLSYAKEDADHVRRVHARLQKDGLRAWRDEHDLLPGQAWDQTIRGAIGKCRLFAVFLSERAVSKAGYIQREIRLAIDIVEALPDDRIFIVPIRLEDCDVPERLKKWHWIDLFKKGGYAHLHKLLLEQLGPRTTVSAKDAAAVRALRPEDQILYEEFVRAGTFRHRRLGTKRYAVTQGHFLVLREDIPAPFRALQSVLTNFGSLTQEGASQVLPANEGWRRDENRVYAIRVLTKPGYVLLANRTATMRCCVDPRYWRLVPLLCGTPEVYLTGRIAPIYVTESSKVRMIVMPLRYSDDEIPP